MIFAERDLLIEASNPFVKLTPREHAKPRCVRVERTPCPGIGVVGFVEEVVDVQVGKRKDITGGKVQIAL